MKKYWHGVLNGLHSNNIILNSVFNIINSFLRIPSFRNLYDKHKHLQGADFINSILKDRGITLKYNQQKLKESLHNDKLIIISNHPHGIIDGLVLIKMIDDIADVKVKVVANEFLSPFKNLERNIILVNPFNNSSDLASKYRGVKKLMKELEQKKTIAFFPAGDVSRFYFRSRKIVDPSWSKTFYKIIDRTDCPILPIYICGRNSLFYHSCVMIHPKLGIPLLIREFLNIRNIQIEIKIGEVASDRKNTKTAIQKWLREKVYRLENQS